jgi:cytoskeleton protein RodZ
MTEHSQEPQPSSAKSAPSSFGERMKRERELRGIKLEEIAESTKIGKRNLVALEQEQFDQLPGGIFNKGFVRAYAKYLGLDEEQAVNDFMTASANYDQPVALQPPPTSWVKPPVIPSDEAMRRRNLRFVLLAGILLAGGFIAWLYWKSRPHAVEEPDKQSSTQTSMGSTSVPPDPAEGGSGAAGAPTLSDKSIPSSSKPSQDTQTARRGLFTVRVQAKEDTWIGVTADGKQVMNILVPAGQERVIHARDQLVLKTGNAGGIEVAHNGVALPAIGRAGEVKTVTFDAKGLEHQDLSVRRLR